MCILHARPRVQRAPGLPCALCFSRAATKATTRVLSAPRDREVIFSWIARESGRSSIPEAAMMETIGRGVLDRPVKPGDDGWRVLFDSKREFRPPSSRTSERKRTRSGTPNRRCLCRAKLEPQRCLIRHRWLWVPAPVRNCALGRDDGHGCPGPTRSPILTIFWHCRFRYFSFRRAWKARPRQRTVNGFGRKSGFQRVWQC
jgi:hypothetical protein